MACAYIYQGKKYNAWEFADVLASMPIDDLMKYLPGAVAAQLSEATQASRFGRLSVDENGDPSQEEASFVENGISGKDPIGAADWLASNAPKQYAEIAVAVRDKLKSIADGGVKLGLSVAYPGGLAESQMSVARGGTFPFIKDGVLHIKVSVNGSGMTGRVGTSFRTVLHELAHAATIQAIRAGERQGSVNEQAVRDLYAVSQAILEHTRNLKNKTSLTEFERSLVEGRNNMLANVDEVVAWALSSHEAQAYLDSIPYKGKSLWTAFVEAIRRAFGLSSKSDTALSEVLRVSEILLKPGNPYAVLPDSLSSRQMIDQPKLGGQSFNGYDIETQQPGNGYVEANPGGISEVNWFDSSGNLPDTITINGVERPTRNSNGQPISVGVFDKDGNKIGSAEEGIRNFYAWFGDSKVVDADGRPLVVYHGTSADFDSFSTEKLGESTKAASAKKGFFFTSSPMVASSYAIAYSAPEFSKKHQEKIYLAKKARFRVAAAEKELEAYGWGEYIIASESERKLIDKDLVGRPNAQAAAKEYLAALDELLASQIEDGANILPVYLKIENPAVLDYEGDHYRDVTYASHLTKAISSGNDGAILKNTFDAVNPTYSEMMDVYVAFSPTQIKSATGNYGDFDPANQDIRRSFAGQSSATDQKSTVSASRDRLIEAFGKSLVTQLENIGLLNIAQTELEAIDRAAQMYAEATGQPIEDVRNSMLASIRASRAWHGSPYKFDKFSTEHIGTGEGASRYGWGLYFTDKNEIAEHYRSALTDAKYYVYGVEFEVNDPVVEKILFDNADDLYRAAGLLESYSKDNKAASEEISSLLVAISDNSLKADVGSLYEVEIPGDDVFLLWDSPISEQPDAVRTAIMSMPSASDINLPDSATGEQFYEALVKLWQDDNGIDRYEAKAEASLDLNEAGVKGIKYLDGQSRSAGEGNFNYVVFDDADVQIIDVKYSADGKIQGFYVPQLGKAFVVADNVAAQDMPAVVTHEVGVHMAMDGNPAMEKLAKQAANLIKLGRGNPFFDRIRQRMNEAGETSNEEAMAYMAEEAKKARDRVPNTVKQWLKDVVAAVKSWLFRKGVLGANRMNEADILAVAMSYVKQAAEKKGDGQAKFSRTQWSNDFPDALILRRAEVVHAHPDYRAAKDGDTEAAKRLVQDIVMREDLLKISQLIGKGESLIVAVHAEEAAGKNKIPMAYASFIAEQLGKRLDLRIVQTKKVSRGGSDGMHRVTTEVPFSGEVEPGGKYLIVDDTLTQGGTLADLKGYIEENGGVVVGASTLMGKQYSSKLKPSAETLKALRDRYGRDFENWWESEFGYNFDRLTESEARYLAKIRGEDADTLRDRILAARQDGSWDVANGGVRQDATPADARGTGSDSVKFSRSGGQQTTQTPTPPKETTAQAAQRKIQDKLNRFTVIKEWLAEQGIELSELADVHKAEERMHSRFANKAEDFREKRVKPLVEKIQKAGFSMDDVARFLHAQHAKERNDQIAKINPNLPDGGSGMTNAEAAAILAASSPELAALANELRSITVDTKNILLNSGLISKEMADAWDGAYQHYVPLKGGPDDEAGGKGTGKGLSVREKQRRALGHEKREDDTREDGEWIIENILADHERALMQAEKNRVFQSLLKMAVETSPLDLVTINRPEKRQILKNQASYVVRVKGRPVDSFTTKEAANLFKQSVALSQKGVSPADITIEKTYDQTVALMASPMPGPNEATGYINGQLVRVQFNDDLLARAYNNMGAESLGNILKAGRALNNYFSKIYTGYNPEFLLVNVIRDFQTGLMNTTGEEGIGMAMKAAKNYTMRFRDLFRYARTGNETQWIKMYREDGGNTGAAYLSDLERLGSEIQTEYNAFQGVAANLQKGDYKGAARAAMRKVFDRTLVYIEHVNQAGENAMRLAVYQAMIESGRSRREAASLAKNVTVNFNRKGELGAQMNAAYLFFNASVQGTAAVAHAHFKGKHRMQAWGFSSALLGMGFLLSLLAAEADEVEYEKTSEYERSRNILIPTGDGFFKIPVAFGYGFFWNFGRGMADAQRTGDLGKTPWHIASSFVEEFTPFGATMAGDGPDSEQAMLYSMPTVAQIVGAPVFNRTSMGIPMMPSSFSEYAHARDLMNNGTRGTWADDLAGLLEDVGMDVSPETLKHYGRTFTGGSGMFASSVVDGAKLKLEGAELEVSEIPFFRKLYTVPDVRGARARYYEAKSEAEKALADFKRAVKQGDMETANEIQAEQGELLALARLAANQKKRIKAARDRIDSIRLSGEYGKAAERHIIKNLEAEEAQIYDNYMAIFKARMGR